jgi:hypothetical protein
VISGASVSRLAASGLTVPGLGRWVTVAFSVALLWIFGFAAEARADELPDDLGTTTAVAETDAATEDVASLDAGSGDSTGTVATDPAPTTEPADPIPPTDAGASAPTSEP